MVVGSCWNLGRFDARRAWVCKGASCIVDSGERSSSHRWRLVASFKCQFAGTSRPISVVQFASSSEQSRASALSVVGSKVVRTLSGSCEGDGFVSRDPSQAFEAAEPEEAGRSPEKPEGSESEAKSQAEELRESGGCSSRLNDCSSKVAHAEGDAGCFSFSRQVQIRVPGSKAGSYEGRKIFRSLMRHFVSSKSGLGRFARSLIGLSREPLVGCTRSSSAGLPMPLPFPEMMRGSPLLSRKVDSLKCGVNGIVLVLNYLHLGQPSVAPSCLRLGNRLSAMQWREIFGTLGHCRSCRPRFNGPFSFES